MSSATKTIPPFNIRPVSRAWRTRDGEAAKRPAYRTAWANSCYQRRADGHDDIGPFYFAQRADDLVATGVVAPEGVPEPDVESIWRAADAAALATGDPTAMSAWAVVGDLPDDLPLARQIELIERFSRRHFSSAGMIAEYAVHAARPRRDGSRGRGHVHWLISARCWADSARKGQVNGFWLPGKIWPALKRDWQAMTAGALAAEATWQRATSGAGDWSHLRPRGRRALEKLFA